MVIGTDGLPSDIRVTRSLDTGLDTNAVKAVVGWRFEPGRRRGSAVRVRASIEVSFRLN